MKQFLKQESGAVTVDWVVLTAALVGLGLATMTVVSSGVQVVSTDIDRELSQDDIIKTTFLNTDYCGIAVDYNIYLYGGDTSDARSEAQDWCDEHDDYTSADNSTDFLVYQRDYYQGFLTESDAMLAEIDRQLALGDTLDFEALAAVKTATSPYDVTFTAQQIQGDFNGLGGSDIEQYRQGWQYRTDYHAALIYDTNAKLAERDDYTPS